MPPFSLYTDILYHIGAHFSSTTLPLPEDEIGAYKLLPDGSKEYLLYHTYDICMFYLGRDDLCSGYERCFHKEGYYGIDWWPVVIK